MRGTISALGVLAVAAVAVSVATAVIGDPQLVSVRDAGGNGAATGTGSAISADGRWVAFTSTDDLTATPAAGVRQLYVRDTVGGRTFLASAGATGGAADASIDDPADHRAYAISGDGRYVVFATGATNLVAGDPDASALDVFRKDLHTGAMTLVSRTPDGVAASGPVGGDPDISYDGSRVAYETGTATNLWPGDSSASSDIVVSDLVAGTSALASANAAGAPLSGTIRRPAVSADGRIVAFEDDGVITVRDLVTSTTAIDGPPGLFPDLSGDGHVLVFQNAGAIMRSDAVTSIPTTVTPNGAVPGVSADGSRVVFETPSSLIGSDGNLAGDVYVRVGSGTPQRVSEHGDGSGVNPASGRPAMSADGGAVAFGITDGGSAQTLTATDTDGAADVLVARLPPTDTAGPAINVLSPTDGTSAATATIGVNGDVHDVSGVVALTVNGFPALLGPANTFNVEVPLAVGAGTLTVRATDGAGRVSERLISITRVGSSTTPAALRARARSLRVVRVGRATRVRFVLDAGATRVTVRLWRRVVHTGRAPTWTPANPLRKVAVRRGRRTAVVSPRLLRAGIYQVRVTVVSAGGVAVSVIRHAVARRT